MSILIIGAAQFGLNYGINNKNGQVSPDAIVEILKLAWANGITEIDTAQDYGNSESILGECLKIVGKKFIVHSKFILKEEPIQQSINESLKRLNIPRLGYFYFHRISDYQKYRQLPRPNLPLKDCEGLAVSVYETAELTMAIDDPEIKAIQIPLNLFDCSNDKIQLIDKAKKRGKKIYIRSVFLQGLFFMDASTLPNRLKSLQQPLTNLHQLCIEHHIDIKTLAINFVRDLVNPDGIIVGVDSKEHLQQNLGCQIATLSPSLIQSIQQIKIEDRSLLLPKNWN